MSITTYEEKPSVDQVIHMTVNSLDSPKTQQVYEAEIERFMAFWQGNRTLSPSAALDAYKQSLLREGLANTTINKKLSAVRKLFHTMDREGLLTHQQARSIDKVKGLPVRGKKLGVWLTLNQMKALRDAPDPGTPKGLRDRAILAIFLACGLRQFEVAMLTWDQLRQVDGVWALVNIHGKHHRFRTVPVADWAAERLLEYRSLFNDPHTEGPIFRSIDRWGNWGDGLSAGSGGIWSIIREYAETLGYKDVSPHDLRRSAAKLVNERAGLEQAQKLLGHQSVQTTERYLDTTIDLEGVAKAMEF